MSSIARPTGSRKTTASGHIRFFTAETYNGLTSVNDLCCTAMSTSCCGPSSISRRMRKTYTRSAKVMFAQ